MCGFTGFLSTKLLNDSTELLYRMGNTITHRGPDDGGIWQDNQAGIGLSHRRLSIVDLSPAGHQPMISSSGRYVIAFNGEVYNHLSLRADLDKEGNAPNWRGHSDTETLVACFDAWGIEATIKKTIAMFAFAVWDKQTRQLTLGRDRFGEKPLYYGWQGQGKNAAFLFGSELKALRAHPTFESTINRSVLALQLRHNYIPAPYSIYNGIYKLRPGCLLTISLERPEPIEQPYWSTLQVAQSCASNQFKGSETEAVNALEVLLKDAIQQQMMADVPLGAFLSGGIDSALIVSLMQSQSSRPIKTFTIGYEEKHYNEAVNAKAIAHHLGTDHTELYVTPQQALNLIPRLPQLYDEPFSDTSQIPTFLVSQLAKQQVQVSLSGDAGDELFCGYSRYSSASNLWRAISPLPIALRWCLMKGVTGVSTNIWDQLIQHLPLPNSSVRVNFGKKMHKGAEALISKNSNDLYTQYITHWSATDSLVIGGQSLPTLMTEFPDLLGLSSIDKMMLLDMMTYLPDDNLAKIDRAAMGVSLETRAPFLDHRVAEFAWQLPDSLKMRNGQSKWILRDLLYRYVPKTLVDGPKMGFSIPIDIWLRHDLRDWAEQLLDETRMQNEGFLNPKRIRQKWREHLSGKYDWQFHLWDVLMFQAWLEDQ